MWKRKIMQSERFVHLGLHRLRRGHGDQSKTVMVLFLYFKNRRENMTENEVEVKLAEHGKEIGSLKHRMKEAEDVVNVVHQLAQEMVGLTKEVGFMNQTLVQLTAKVTHLEQTPAKRWDGVVTALIGAIIGAVAAMLF
nr:MAG TPA: YtxH-like protein [Caudoviricetes sp.]